VNRVSGVPVEEFIRIMKAAHRLWPGCKVGPSEWPIVRVLDGKTLREVGYIDFSHPQRIMFAESSTTEQDG
jgi:hypothetical protein